MKKYNRVLTIAGSDSGGGAGIQADIKAITALGGYAASAITALTIQNTLGVTGIFAVPPSVVSEQIACVMEDIAPQSIKIGMVKDVDIVRHIASSIQKYRPPFIVYDPVMVSTSGPITLGRKLQSGWKSFFIRSSIFSNRLMTIIMSNSVIFKSISSPPICS